MSHNENKKPAYDENLFLIQLPAFIFLALVTLIFVISIKEVVPSKDPFPEPTLSVEESAALIAPIVSAPSGASTSSEPALSGEEADGLALIMKNDCVACHKDTMKVVGPAYADIAAKYAGDKTALKALALKIKEGGSGSWGPIPMSAHPTLKDEEIAKMVKYILSLKGGKAPEIVNATSPEVTNVAPVTTENAAIFEMMKNKSDCNACHKEREVSVGPSYLEVAKKYKDSSDIKVLVEKIKKGGTGVWGQIPMIAHPQLTDEEIEKMVKAILSIK